MNFTVQATGSGPLGYQWRLNGIALTAGTNASLVLAGVQGWQVGRYSVLVSDNSGSAVSNDAVLSVTPSAPPVFVWANTAGGSDVTAALGGAAADAEGNCYLTGVFSGTTAFGTNTLTSTGAFDVFVAKCDPSGAWAWARQAGGLDQDMGYGVAVDGLGNLFVTGDFVGPAAFGSAPVNSVGTTDMFLAKYSSEGVLQWVRTEGASGSGSYGNGVASDGAGNAYVGGGGAVYVAKYGPTGTRLWSRAPRRNTGMYGAYGIGVNSKGDGAIWGYTPFPTQYEYVDFISSSGAWGGTLLLEGTTSVGNVAVDSAGNAYVVGSFSSPLYLGSVYVTNAGSYDGYVAKCGSGGDVQWVRTVAGTHDDWVSTVTIDASGNPCIAGRFTGTAQLGNLTFTSEGGRAFFIAKLDSRGAPQWARQIESGPGVLQDLSLVGSSNLFVTGSFTGKLELGDVTLSSTGQDRSVFVGRLVYAVGPPEIITPPRSQTLIAGARAEFSVSAVGETPLFFQWRKDTTNLDTATNKTLSLQDVQPAAAGGYSVLISNVQGAVTSSVGILTVNHSLVVDIDGNGTVSRTPEQTGYAPGSVLALTAVPLGGESFLGWSGNAGGDSNPLTITMDRNKTIAATFSTRTANHLVRSLDDAGPRSLRGAILAANANGGGTIAFPEVTGTITLLSALPAITGNTQIVGPGTNHLTITGQNASPALSVSLGSTSAISGLAFVQLATTNFVNGAAVSNGGVLDVTDCAFRNNSTPGFGGAIYSGGRLMLGRSTFKGNWVGDSRDGPGSGGALYTSDGTVWIQDCDFVGNQARGNGFNTGGAQPAMGGAIVVERGTLSILGSVFTGNRVYGYSYGASAAGGAIYVGSLASDISISGCSLSGNRALGGDDIGPDRVHGGFAHGGAICAGGGTTLITNTSIQANSVETASIYQSWGSYEVGAALGAGIYLRDGALTLANSTFAGNSLKSGDGGSLVGVGPYPPVYPPGAAKGAGLYVEAGSVSMLNNTFSSNTVQAGNGGSFSYGLFDYRRRGGDAWGGGIYVATGIVTVANCTITANHALGGPGYDSASSAGLPGAGLGGGIANSNGTVRLLNTIVAGNAGGTAANSLADVSGTFLSGGFNLIGATNGASGFVPTDILRASPALGPLQFNGGPTFTHALLTGSPAIDAGTVEGAPWTDQRGFPRPAGRGFDIGAYEYRSAEVQAHRNSGRIQLMFVTEPFLSYIVQSTTDFVTWQTVSTAPASTNGFFLLEEPLRPSPRFYRASLPP